MPTKKRVVKKTTKKVIKPKVTKTKEKLAGEVLHYFDKINVAVIKAKIPIKVGDTLRFEGGEETDFKQKISSMEVDYKKVKTLKKGGEAGIKIKEKVREGYRVYKA